MTDATSTEPAKNVQKADNVHFIGIKKADPLPTAAGSEAQSNAYQTEDEFHGFYLGGTNDKAIIEPPYNFKTLTRLALENNALSPCIEAMVTNIDGTGFEFKLDDDTAEDNDDDTKIDQIWDLFNEPWPGESFITLRRKLRRDLETTGNGYLEVIENAAGEILFIRHVESKLMRMVKLDAAVNVPHSVKRKGKEITVNLSKRERRFAQVLEGKTLVYFKEFGASRDLNKNNGQWSAKGQRLPQNSRATSILHLTVLPDVNTPYGVPRWINQLPSVIGSRKAEEFNLEYFENGGVPPVLIILQGGVMAGETSKAFEQKTSGGATKLNRVQVIQVEPAGGTLEKPTTAKVTVERFGSEKQNDSMFEKYDDKCEVKVRRAFRLPPIFVGAAQDYSFATAFASYTVAEAQVFKPDRDEFDEMITIKVLPALGFAGYRLQSNPLAIADTQNQLKGVEIAKEIGAVEPADLIEAINNIVGTNMKVSDKAFTLEEERANKKAEQDAALAKVGLNGQQPSPTPSTPPQRGKPNLSVVKSEGILALATDTALALRNRDFDRLAGNTELVKGLSEKEAGDFRQALSTFQFIDPTMDIDGLAEIAGCTIAVMAMNHADGHVTKEDGSCACGVKH